MSAPSPSFLLDQRAGWRLDPSVSTGVQTVNGPLTLSPQPAAAQVISDPSGSFGGLTAPTGVAIGPRGEILVLDRSGHRVLRYDPGSRTFAPLGCLTSDPSLLGGAAGIAVTGTGDVVLADPVLRRVLLVSGDGRGVRAVLGPVSAVPGTRPVPSCPDWVIAEGGVLPEPRWPVGDLAPWSPIAVAAAGTRIAVLDAARALVVLFDQFGRWCATTDGSGAGLPPLSEPIAVALDLHGRIYVLEKGRPSVRQLGPDGVAIADLDSPASVRQDFRPVLVAVDADGRLCVSDRAGCLLLGDPGSPGSPGGLAPCDSGLDSAVSGLAFDSSGSPVLVDQSRQCVVRLSDGGGYPRRGEGRTEPLDSGWTARVWHRIELTACIPAGTSVRIDTLTAEAPFDADTVEALPPDRWVTGPEFRTSTGDGGPETVDQLIRSAGGRYLWLRIVLSGDGSTTPVVESLRVELPRDTSTRFLPAVYTADPAAGDFTQRFVALFDTMTATIDRHLDRLPAFLDPWAVPDGEHGLGGTSEYGDFLSWLAAWVGAANDAGLPTRTRRALIARAADLYARRGTPSGVADFVGLFSGSTVRVLEQYRLRHWAFAGRTQLGVDQLFGPSIVGRLQLDVFSRIGEFTLVDTGDPALDPFAVHAHRFTVFLLPHADTTPDDAQRWAQLAIELAKPAHTVADLVLVRARMCVGRQATIGFDTVIGGLPEPGESRRLGDGFVLAGEPVPPGGALVGTHRLGGAAT
ncbi:phage tail protein domain-containing protein [Actinopolymorpha cephalotaxi]|uniref:Phage tail protein domain-containing protein n=1 Tax=Actinopolymorpha cephalotaxi TaxID=504797 RepID=A0A1I3BSJ6_9ACTN|nr:phage tail protein [Actinopolymorpha cephalotaxi]NYH83752.1 phage tail-like protein [Actinopolymorpha cephalotaxi]SFH65150.1 phage tail protein domain-containing protein [Actinopolymorpha cephalotaxi]